MHAHAELLRDCVRRVDPTGARPSDIEFLESGDVRFAGGDNLGDAAGREAAVAAEAAMHVVSQMRGNS